MEKEFEDELFFECDEADLGQFMRNRAEKVAKIKTVGKILAHMDNADEVFNVSTLFLSLHASITLFSLHFTCCHIAWWWNTSYVVKDAHAEGAANMIRGMATYIADTADIPTYVKTSQRTG